MFKDSGSILNASLYLSVTNNLEFFSNPLFRVGNCIHETKSHFS